MNCWRLEPAVFRVLMRNKQQKGFRIFSRLHFQYVEYGPICDVWTLLVGIPLNLGDIIFCS